MKCATQPGACVHTVHETEYFAQGVRIMNLLDLEILQSLQLLCSIACRLILPCFLRLALPRALAVLLARQAVDVAWVCGNRCTSGLL